MTFLDVYEPIINLIEAQIIKEVFLCDWKLGVIDI